MSYICLLANENGVVCASDSRETSTLTHRYKDKRQKTFAADAKNAVWCCCGSSKIGHLIYATDCMKRTEKILNDVHLPFETRLEHFQEFIRRETRPPLLKKKTVYTFTILFAFDDGKTTPCIGTITAKGGKITDKRFFTTPIMLEAGKNSPLLSPRTPYVPKKTDTVAAMRHKAMVRVREAIRYDIQAKAADRTYMPTVGGKVQIETLRFRKQ